MMAGLVCTAFIAASVIDRRAVVARHSPRFQCLSPHSPVAPTPRMHAAPGGPIYRFYLGLLPEARAYAGMQGYAGARWFKMRGPVTNRVFTGPSPVGPLLIEEQPHPIVHGTHFH